MSNAIITAAIDFANEHLGGAEFAVSFGLADGTEHAYEYVERMLKIGDLLRIDTEDAVFFLDLGHVVFVRIDKHTETKTDQQLRAVFKA